MSTKVAVPTETKNLQIHIYLDKVSYLLVVLINKTYDSSVFQSSDKLVELIVALTSISLLLSKVQLRIHSLIMLLKNIRFVSLINCVDAADGATTLKRTFQGSKWTRSLDKLHSPVGIGQTAPYLPHDKRQSS